MLLKEILPGSPDYSIRNAKYPTDGEDARPLQTTCKNADMWGVTTFGLYAGYLGTTKMLVHLESDVITQLLSKIYQQVGCWRNLPCKYLFAVGFPKYLPRNFVLETMHYTKCEVAI